MKLKNLLFLSVIGLFLAVSSLQAMPGRSGYVYEESSSCEGSTSTATFDESHGNDPWVLLDPQDIVNQESMDESSDVESVEANSLSYTTSNDENIPSSEDDAMGSSDDGDSEAPTAFIHPQTQENHSSLLNNVLAMIRRLGVEAIAHILRTHSELAHLLRGLLENSTIEGFEELFRQNPVGLAALERVLRNQGGLAPRPVPINNPHGPVVVEVPTLGENLPSTAFVPPGAPRRPEAVGDNEPEQTGSGRRIARRLFSNNVGNGSF